MALFLSAPTAFANLGSPLLCAGGNFYRVGIMDWGHGAILHHRRDCGGRGDAGLFYAGSTKGGGSGLSSGALARLGRMRSFDGNGLLSHRVFSIAHGFATGSE